MHSSVSTLAPNSLARRPQAAKSYRTDIKTSTDLASSLGMQDMSAARALLPLLLPLLLLQCSAEALTTRVLFVGNSYTYFNELDQLYSSMATAALAQTGRRVEAGRVAKPNYWLRQHVADDASVTGSVWDEFREFKAAGALWTLVLQEVSSDSSAGGGEGGGALLALGRCSFWLLSLTAHH